MDKKTVLFIAYHFPPDPAVGSIRPAKFVKYLCRMGWNVIVLTIPENNILLRDGTRLDDVGPIAITRKKAWPTVVQLMMRLRDFIRGKITARSSNRENTTMGQAGGAGRLSSQDTKARAAITKYLDALFQLPDKEVGWLVPAVFTAWRLVRKYDIRVVVTTSPPRTTALVGLALWYLTRISLFTDLRDPWYRPIWESKPDQTWLSRKVLGWMEKKIFEHSEKVITTTQEYADFLRSRYRHVLQEKCEIIWNGYDEEDFRNLEAIRQDEKFTISYLGTFYFGRSPKTLLQALGQLVSARQLDKSRLAVKFIGDVRYAEGERVEDMVLKVGLSECVTLLDPIPYKNALAVMKQSHVLLLFAPDQYYCVPAKAFEYIGSCRNILCFAKKGPTMDLVAGSGAGIVVAPDDVDGIKLAVLGFYKDYADGKATGGGSDPEKYNRKIAALELSRLLEGALAN